MKVLLHLIEPRDHVQYNHVLGRQDTQIRPPLCLSVLWSAFLCILTGGLGTFAIFLVGAGGLFDPDLGICIGIYSGFSTFSAVSEFSDFHLPCCRTEPFPPQLPARSTGHHCIYTMAMFTGPTAGCTLHAPALEPSISGVAATYSFARTHHDHTLAFQVSQESQQAVKVKRCIDADVLGYMDGQGYDLL
jgi:hypothetical protein